MAKTPAKVQAGPQSSDPRRDPYEPSEDEKTVVKHWLAIVARAEKDNEAFFKDLKTMREYAAGTKHNDESGTKYTRTNLIFATVAGIVPEIYAKNPEVAVKPSKGCPKSRLKLIKDFGRTAEQFLNETVTDEAKLKKRAKANIRSALITSYGVLKFGYQHEYRGDAIAVRRMQDAQDNLSALEATARDIKGETDITELALKRDEMRAQLKGLESSNEVKIYKGFVLDRVRSEDFLVLDSSIVEFDEYVEAAALGHKIWMRVSEYRKMFGHYPEKATKWTSPYQTPDTPAAAQIPEGMKEEDQYVCIIEIWDKTSGVIRWVAKGSERWCREARAPKATGERWYPFFVLGFDLLEGRWRPLSQPELLMGLQDEYNETRTAYAEDRKDGRPMRFFRMAGNLTEEDIIKIRDRKSRDIVGLKGSPTVPLDQDIGQLDGLLIKAENYDVSMIRNDIDMVAGRSDASRANLIKPKTATEAELMAQAMGSRSEERRDVSEDLMSDVFQYALEIGLRCFTLDEVKRICGEDAVWPGADLSVDEIYSMVDVGVRAGSSGKPNSEKDKEQWLQLLPIVEKAVSAVAEARATGNMDMANTAIELLRETIRRFEDRVDVDSLIPPAGEGEGPGQMLAQTQQQLAQLQEQLQLAQEELVKCQQDLQKAQAKEQEAVVKAQGDLEQQARDDAQAARELELNAEKEARDALAAEQAAEREDEIARYKIDKEAETKIEVAKISAQASEEQKVEKEEQAIAGEREKAERMEAVQVGQQRHEEAMARVEALMTEVTQAMSQFAEGLKVMGQSMADSAQAERETEFRLGDDGLPLGAVSRPVKRTTQ